MGYPAYQTLIDLSRIPAPNIIDELDYETVRERYWADVLSKDPRLTKAKGLEQSPANMILGAQAYGEMLIRARINAAVRAVLAPLARGADLDNIAARFGLQRLIVVPATDSTNQVMESDAQLLRRYLLAFDRPSAGSADAYLFHAYSAWPLMHDGSVLGRAIHNRPGYTDIVITGPAGRMPTDIELARVQAAVGHPSVKPEATAVTVVPAQRVEYQVELTIAVSLGPDPVLVKNEAIARVLAATAERTFIGAEVPAALIKGAAFGPNVIDVVGTLPQLPIPPRPYAIPVCTSVSIGVEVRS